MVSLQPSMPSTLQSKRLSFSTGLRPTLVGQRDLSLNQVESKPFDCLVHLACSLLHPENILACPSSTH